MKINPTRALVVALITSASCLPLIPLVARADTPDTLQTTQDTSPSWTTTEVIVRAKRSAYGAPVGSASTRTDTPLIEVPQSVQVLTSTLMKEQDNRTLANALVNVSGVTPTQSAEVLFTPPIVRGFPAEVYVDGLPIFGGNQQAFDPAGLTGIERIEVLKGPSSTLYGGGLGSPLGGLINIASERPTDTFGGFVALRGGSYSTWNPYGDINLPVAKGVGLRIAGEYQKNESWVDQVDGEKWSIKPSLSFQFSPNTDLLLQGQFNRTRQLEYSGLPAEQALAGQVDRNAFPGAPLGQPQTTVSNQLATATFHHAFSDDLKLTVSGRYYNSTVLEYGTFIFPAFYAPDPATPTVYPILPMNMRTTTKEGALDANLLAKVEILGGQHELLGGVSYDETRFVSGMAFYGVPVGDIDLASPAYTLSFGGAMPLNLLQTDRYQTAAAYLQDQATYGRLHLTGALRFTQLKFHEMEQGTDKSYSHISPRFGATFDVAPGVALYAGYATAFRAPFGFIGLETPKPETSTNYEAGVKLAMKRIGLSGTIALFDQTRENIATPDPDPTHLNYSVQTGQQRAKGVEADIVWEPTPAFSLLANYANTDARVTKDNSIPVGDVLPRVPRNSGRIAARYRVLNGVAKGLSFGAGVTAFGDREDTLPNTVAIPGYAAIDAQAAYEWGRYTIELSVVNLGDRKAYDTYQYFGFPVVMPIQPRSGYITLKASF